jgi:hypothetical protein
MPMPLASAAYLLLGVLCVAVAVHVVRTYRQFIKSDPATTITSDLVFVLLFGSWSPPALLAAIVFYIGALSLLLGLFIAWQWLVL